MNEMKKKYGVEITPEEVTTITHRIEYWWPNATQAERARVLENAGNTKSAAEHIAETDDLASVGHSFRNGLVAWLFKNPDDIPHSFDVWVFRTGQEREEGDLAKAKKVGTVSTPHELFDFYTEWQGPRAYTRVGVKEIVPYPAVMVTWKQEPWHGLQTRGVRLQA